MLEDVYKEAVEHTAADNIAVSPTIPNHYHFLYMQKKKMFGQAREP